MDRNLKEGMKVRVAFDPKYQIIDGSRKFDGMDMTIARVGKVKRWYANGNAINELYYELDGAETQKHIPYGFLEQNLVPLV